jgi:uncharacterized protein YebE (UPF0316 family)
MGLIDSLPIWGLATAVFLLRVCDVSLGTVRTISVVHGRVGLSVFLGFFEILVWITAVSQVIVRVREFPILVLAYAGGFAAGNAVGIAIERRLAIGWCVVLMISRELGSNVAAKLRSLGQTLTTIDGEGRDGPRTLVYATVPRRGVRKIVAAAKSVDPDLFYAVQYCSETSQLGPLAPANGWRSAVKKK